ncbi:MAG: hypothetical protein N5P05_004147 (plasmid) [Chroococcopsis gigantea SAG 12.99]|nr:hypothetical protein [Chroococcopsis gigantea SAG 12.99]
MDEKTRVKLSALYKSDEINQIWNVCQSKPFINHPQYGNISAGEYRQMGMGKSCPFCGQKMTYGQQYKTSSLKEAIDKGFEYINKKGQKTINQAGNVYFHRKYITLDHIINKARCPEKMFDYDNLQYMCWECNQEKGDNNAYEIEHTLDYLNDLADEVLERYKPL